MEKKSPHCPTWAIFEEKFAICIRQALRPLQHATPKTIEEILKKVLPKLSDRLRIVRPEIITEEVLRQSVEMGLLSEKGEKRAKEMIQEIKKTY